MNSPTTMMGIRRPRTVQQDDSDDNAQQQQRRRRREKSRAARRKSKKKTSTTTTTVVLGLLVVLLLVTVGSIRVSAVSDDEKVTDQDVVTTSSSSSSSSENGTSGTATTSSSTGDNDGTTLREEEAQQQLCLAKSVDGTCIYYATADDEKQNEGTGGVIVDQHKKKNPNGDGQPPPPITEEEEGSSDDTFTSSDDPFPEEDFTSSDDDPRLVSPGGDIDSLDPDGPEYSLTQFDAPPPSEEKMDCLDEHKNCEEWAFEDGECEGNSDFMTMHCPVSCNTCDYHRERRFGELPEGIHEEERFGIEQVVDGEEAEETLMALQKSIEYMRDVVYQDPQYRYVRERCINDEDLCTFWSIVGECENNVDYMTKHCSPACQTCHMLDFDMRCPLIEETMPDALKKGDLHAMFERIIDPANEDVAKYKPMVHSRPKPRDDEKIIVPPDQTLEYQTDGPWVVTFDNFMTHEECDRLVELGYKEGYERSSDVGEELDDGSFEDDINEGRTSENAWCFEDCQNDKHSRTIMERIVNVTGIPWENSEDFQILKYEIGQKYNEHHDYIEHQQFRQCGPRILTFFLYLSDVEEGGETYFNTLGIKVTPKKGKALLWPSVINDDPSEIDDRTMHEALPVLRGTKFAANSWIHLRNFVEPNKIGCA